MKIDLITDKEAQSSGLEVSQMGFDTSKTAKLFHMLSNTLYSDKPSSIVRELSSNAYDAHKEAGNLDTPFRIISPTYENPVLEIRDFGTGLTAEEAEKTILNYLGSTKDGTDEFIGGWGIGSKSPFAYSYTYEVIVYKNGEFTHFTCWKNDAGIPNKAVIDSGDTDQPNGVLIRVPIQSADISTFQTTCRKYLDWTNYNLELIENGHSKAEKRQPIAEKEFDGYKVLVYRQGSGHKRLVYGGFSYPMDQCVDNKYDYTSDWFKLSNKLKYGYDIAFVIDTPNAVSFNMNREVLEQTEKSRSFVAKIIKELKNIAEYKAESFKKVQNTIGGLGDLKTLVDVDSAIDKISEEFSKQDKTFEQVFVTDGIGIQFDFKSPELKKITATNVVQAHTKRFDILPTVDQISIAWGKRIRMSPYERRTFLNKHYEQTKDGKLFLYVKAVSESAAREILKKLPEFAGYNIDLLDFYEVQIEVNSSSRVAGTRIQTNPVVYCTERKKRIPWDEEHKYVLLEKGLAETTNNLNDVCEGFIALNKVHFLVPSPKTLENLEGRDNVYSLLEFEEEVETWFRDLKDIYLCEKDYDLLSKFVNWAYRTMYDRTLGRIPGHCKNFGKILEEAQSVQDRNRNIKFIVISNQGLLQKLEEKSHGRELLNALQNRATKLYSKNKKLLKISSFIGIEELLEERTKNDVAEAIYRALVKLGFNL